MTNPAPQSPGSQSSAPQSSAPQSCAIRDHHFQRPELLREALTHRSAAHAGGNRNGKAGQGSNERLEFVGDRVLGLVVAEWLAERFPDEQEGDLGPRHAALVSRAVLARIAEKVGLPDLVSVAPNEARAGVAQLTTVLADAMEAVIGAMYFDSGLETVRGYIRRAWAEEMESQLLPPKDPKTLLQERLLSRRQKLPHYEVVSREGPPHAPLFTVVVTTADGTGRGTATSKREAERLAAGDLLSRLT